MIFLSEEWGTIYCTSYTKYSYRDLNKSFSQEIVLNSQSIFITVAIKFIRFLFSRTCFVIEKEKTRMLASIVSHLYLVSFSKKKVLLRERKRHTAHRVASPWRGGGGECYLPWPGGTYLGQGVSTLAGLYLPWQGGTYLGRGVLTLSRGVPTLAGVPSWVWTYKQTETTTFPHPTDAGGKKDPVSIFEISLVSHLVSAEINLEWNVQSWIILINILNVLPLDYIYKYIYIYIYIYICMPIVCDNLLNFSIGRMNHCNVFQKHETVYRLHKSLDCNVSAPSPLKIWEFGIHTYLESKQKLESRSTATPYIKYGNLGFTHTWTQN